VKLHFSNLNELRDHVQRIEAGNHTTLKKWTAAQNFFHLASAFEGSLEGLPPGYPKIIRLLVRPFRWILTSYRFPPWMPIPGTAKFKLQPEDGLDFEQQKSRLLQSIDAFEDRDAKRYPHPVLGSLSFAQWTGFHLRHCEHHLSFVEIVDNKDKADAV